MPKVCLMCGESFPDTTTFCPKDGSALRAAVKGDDLIGELIGERYLITDLISHGGMGSVYLASDVRLPQQFAVKVLKEQMSPDPAVISRFRQEAEAVCRINHDRVARVFDFGFMEDGRAYIIMEFASGKTLRDVMDARAPFDLREASKITTMISEGLDAAHRLGIIHRDLKPENVIVVDDPGGTMRIKVLDFGIAKLIDNEAGKGYTQPGFVIGTPIWMSPEQLRGEALDARSDVYSLALLTFAMLTGERPFVGDTEQTEMLARLAATPRTLAEVAPQVRFPADLQAIFDRTFSRDVADRPSSAMSFAEAIASVAPSSTPQGGVSRPTPSASSVPVTGTPAARTPAAGATAASTPVKGSSTPATSSSKTKVFVFSGIGVVAIAAIAVMMLKPFGGGSSVDGAAGEPMTSAQTPATNQPTSAPTVNTPDSSAVAPASTDNPAAVAATPTTSPTSPPPVVVPKPEVSRPPVATSQSGGVTKPPVPPAEKPTETPARGATRNAELQRVMAAYDADGSATNSRVTINKIDALRSQLTQGIDQAYAQFYLGMSYATLREKDQACAAFKQARALGAESNFVRSSSDDWRIQLGCGPQ